MSRKDARSGKRKPLQLGLTVLLLLAVIIMIGVIMSSAPVLAALGSFTGLGDTTLAAWDILRWPIFAAALIGMIAILYQQTGNLPRPEFRWSAMGAVLAMIAMGAASGGFALYVSNFSRYNETFGTFAGVIVFLIWLFLINAALLLGVKFNAELERARQLQAGLPAEENLLLTPRNTTLIERCSRSDTITRQHEPSSATAPRPLPAQTASFRD